MRPFHRISRNSVLVGGSPMDRWRGSRWSSSMSHSVDSVSLVGPATSQFQDELSFEPDDWQCGPQATEEAGGVDWLEGELEGPLGRDSPLECDGPGGGGGRKGVVWGRRGEGSGR